MQSASSNHQLLCSANISQRDTSSPWKVGLEFRTRFDLEVKTSEGSIVEIWNSTIVPYPRIPNILPRKSCAASRSRAHNLLEIANAWTQTRREYGIFNQNPTSSSAASHPLSSPSCTCALFIKQCKRLFAQIPEMPLQASSRISWAGLLPVLLSAGASSVIAYYNTPPKTHR